MTDAGHASRVALGRTKIDAITMDAALDAIAQAASDPSSGFLVVTPNIQHIVLLESNPDFRDAYERADLILPDGWPVARAAGRMSGRHVDRVAGADLFVRILEVAGPRGLTVGLVGGRPDAARKAAARARKEHPSLSIPLVDESTFGPEGPDSDVQRFTELVSGRVDLLVLGLGTPKQEVLAARALAGGMRVGAVLCLGASIDFYAGAQRRAPEGWQRANLEWAYRVGMEPGRLARRYAVSAPKFSWIALRSMRRASPRQSTGPRS